jgi:NhaA family Na+:H+ antiporter
VLGGVGFTVALLVAELAFSGQPELQDQAKTAVPVASLLAALLATVAVRLRKPAEPD